MTAHRSAYRARHTPPVPSSAASLDSLARVGDFSFLNCAPIRWGLAASGQAHRFDSLSAPPARIATELRTGRLDVGPVSLVEYLRHADELLLLPGLAIGSDGPVQSCHLVSPVPLTDLHDRTVALSETSRTTVLLVRMLLEDAFGARPVYLPHRQDLDAMLDRADAAVLIGDDALRLNTTGRPGYTVHDTGELWRDWTGLPMVFAVWAVRRSFALDQPERLRGVHAALLDAVALARGNPDAVASAAARECAASPRGRLDERVLADYYAALDYCLGARHLASIREFARRAAARGEVPANARPLFAPALCDGAPLPVPRPYPAFHGGHP